MDQTMPEITERRLLQALMHFRRVGWQMHHSIEGCKPSESRALFVLKKCAMHQDAPAMKVSEISKVLHVTSPTVTQILNSLEGQGLIERHTDVQDRRAVVVILTDKGDTVAQQAMEAFFHSIHGLVEYLGEEESNQLSELLFKATRYFVEKQASSNYQALWNGEDEV